MFVSRHLGTTLLVWLLIGIALALPAALYLVEANLARFAGDWHGKAGLTVYFEPGADALGPATLAQQLAQQGGVERVRLITPAEALAEFRERADAAGALALLDHNPLPATLRVIVATDMPVARLTQLATLAESATAVDDVVVERTWLARLAAIHDVVERLSWAVAALLGLGAVLVSSASVRLAIEARLAELQVLTLVGAGRRFIRRPFPLSGRALWHWRHGRSRHADVGGASVDRGTLGTPHGRLRQPLGIGRLRPPCSLIGMLVSGALLG